MCVHENGQQIIQPKVNKEFKRNCHKVPIRILIVWKRKERIYFETLHSSTLLFLGSNEKMCYERDWHFLRLKQDTRTTEGATEVQLVESGLVLSWLSVHLRETTSTATWQSCSKHKLQSCTDLQIACWLKKVSMQALAS